MNSAISGFYWVTGTQYLSTAIRFLGGIYLARMIDPVFFGQQGLAISVVMLIWSFVMIGEQPALMKKLKDVKTYVQVLLFIRIVIVSILTAIVVFLWLIGWLPGSEAVKNYTLILFLSQVPAQIGSIYVAYIHKNMLFSRMAAINLVSTVTTVSVSCVLAFMGYTIWALLWLFMLEQLVRALLSIVLTPEIILPKFNKVLAMEFFHFSKYAVSTSLLDRFQSKVDDISIGSIVGEAPLGFYQRSYGLGGLLQTVLSGGLSTVVQPYFARIQGNREKFGQYFELVSSIIIRISSATFICLAFVLPEIIERLYGEKWLPAVPIFRLMLPFAILNSFRSILRNTHQVAGSIKYLTIAQIFETIILIACLYPLIYWQGLTGAAIAVNISTISGVGSMLFYLKQFAEFSVIKIFLNPIISSLVASSAVFWSKPLFINEVSSLVNVGITIAFFTFSYIISLSIIEYSFIKTTIRLLFNRKQ